MNYQIINADFLDWIKEYDGPPFHCILSDWPYNLESIQKRFGPEGAAPAKVQKDAAFVRKSRGFLQAAWDSEIAYHPETWQLIKPHLLPGGFTVGFTHVRKQHRLATAQEDTGYLIQPSFYNYQSGQVLQVPAQLGWIYGSGMAHGTDISKALDKAAGIERPDSIKGGHIGILHHAGDPPNGKAAEFEKLKPHKNAGNGGWSKGIPITDLAKTWQGYQYGSPLAPEIEPIIIAQKPWGGHRQNRIIETGAGAINIAFGQSQKVSDRFPGTLILEHHPGCRQVGWKEFRNTNGSVSGNEPGPKTNGIYGTYDHNGPFQAKGESGIEILPDYDCHPDCHVARLGDERARYFFQSDWQYEIIERLTMTDPIFYHSKVGPKERNAGLDNLPDQVRRRVNPGGLENEARFANTIQKNNHPTLKPIKLCKYLAGLFLPPPEYAPRRILIPTAGTMSEAIGAALAGWDEIIAIEMDPGFAEIGQTRMAWWSEWLKYGQTDVDTILSALANKPEQIDQYEQIKMF